MNLIAAFRNELALVLLALVSLGVGLLGSARARVLGHGLAGCVLGLAVWQAFQGAPDVIQGVGATEGVFRADGMGQLFRQLTLLATAFVLLIAAEYSEEDRFAAEQYALVLFGASAISVIAVATDLVMLFVALELLTTVSYVLVGHSRGGPQPVEAGVKYFAVGALSTAFLAYGICYLFGTSGATSYEGVRMALAQTSVHSAAQWLGVVFLLAGIAFKLAIVPGHLWVADVYQGAPLPAVAFLAVGSKVAGFAALLRILYDMLMPLQAQWAPVLLVVGAISVLWGNLGALRQKNVQRLLGYSSIAHSGYILIGSVAANVVSASAAVFYLVQYALSTLACYLVLSSLTRAGKGTDLTALTGLSRRSPLLGWVMAGAMLSLAGVPPLSGFIGKYMLLAAIPAPVLPEAFYVSVLSATLIGIVLSIVYYFSIIRALWADPAADKAASTVPTGRVLSIGLSLCAAGILGLGVYQTPVMKLVDRAGTELGLH